MMRDTILENLDVVERHIRDEARDVDAAMALYTDDAVLEVPSRGLVLRDRGAIRDNYVRMFASMAEVEIEPLERFATLDRVVDDMRVRFRLVGDGMVGAPVPIGTRVELRLIHHFSMRAGRICREQVFELWRALEPVAAATRAGGAGQGAGAGVPRRVAPSRAAQAAG